MEPYRDVFDPVLLREVFTVDGSLVDDPVTGAPRVLLRPLAAARAEFLTRLHRLDDARLAYQEALHLTDNAVERDFLPAQLHQLDH